MGGRVSIAQGDAMGLIIVGIRPGVLAELFIAADILQEIRKHLVGVIPGGIGISNDFRRAQADSILHADGDSGALIDISLQVDAAVGDEQQHK